MISPIDNQRAAASHDSGGLSRAANSIVKETQQSIDQRDIVELSPRARELHSRMSSNQLDRAHKIRIEAEAISRSQGLESGRYDFSHLTHHELETILNDILLNQGDPDPEATSGLSMALTMDGTGFGGDMKAVNYLEIIKNMRDERKYRHDIVNMTRFQSAESLILTYHSTMPSQ